MKDIGVQVVSGMSDQLYFFYKNRFIEQLEEKDKYCIQAMKLSSACENLFFTSQKLVQISVSYWANRPCSRILGR